jgi:hypothetical protein
MVLLTFYDVEDELLWNLLQVIFGKVLTAIECHQITAKS